MLAKRIIPCLDVKNVKTVKGVNFENFRDAGDPVELGRRYSDEGADELVFLDITASLEGRDTFVNVVRRVAENLNIPFTVGGGINKMRRIDYAARKDAINAQKRAAYALRQKNRELTEIILKKHRYMEYVDKKGVKNV